MKELMRTVLRHTALFCAAAGIALCQTTFSNGSAISSTGTLGTTLYPSTINVSGVSGTISNVNVRLKGFTHSFPNGLDILLTGPAGQKLIVMSDSGRAAAVSNISFTLSDSGATRLPNLTDGTPGPIQNNTTYKPTDSEAGDSFPGPAPAGPYLTPAPVGSATFASAFNGGSPNGTWSLFISSDTAGDVWTFANGWELILTAAADAATSTTLSSSQNPSFTAAPNNTTTLTATVTSSGSPVSVGSVTFSSNGSPIGGPVSLNAGGVATLSTSFATEGVKTLTAVYNPASGFATSSGTLSQTVNNHTDVSGNTFCNNGPNSLPGGGRATIYPQRIFTTGLGGSISGVSLQLKGLTHSASNGLDIMLVAPNGAAFVPLSDTAGALSFSNITLTLSDVAGVDLPSSGALSSGTFRPKNYAPASDSDAFPAPAPASPLHASPTGAATFASAFAGGTPNGTWLLYMNNDTGGDTGSSTGYCITLATTSDAGTTTTVTSSQNPSLRTSSVTFTASVKRTDNSAPVTAGTVTFTENATVLAGPVALNGSGEAAFSTSSLNEGSHVITATYSGSPGSFNTSFGTITQQVDNQTTPGPTANSFCNAGITSVPANGLAQPYGQRILVPGLAGAISNLTVSLNGLTNATPDDWDFLLVSPSGQQYVLMGDAGGVNTISGVNIVLSDAGATLPNSTVLTNGTYKPAVYESAAFPAPAPAGPYVLPPATLASTFGGANPAGYWSFFVADDVAGASSSVGGYCLNFTLTPPDLTISKTHSGTFRQGQTNVTYTIRVTNNGPGSTLGLVTVDDTLPAGLVNASMAGTGWSCTSSPLRCQRSDALAAGTSFPDITLTADVSASAAASITNSATVSGGGDGNAANNTASDPTTVVAAADMTVTKSHTGDFTVGQTGTYTITVRNSGAGPSGGTVTVSDNLPAPMTAQSISGTGWTCELATVSCTRSDALAASTNYPAITLMVNVNSGAGSSVTNQAVVTGGGEINNTNNVANDPTNLVAGTFSVSVSTNIPGLSFAVDGTSYTSLQTFAWSPGSPHTIATATPQGSGGTRYVWQNWSDGGAISHNVSPVAAASYVANFGTEYLLTSVSHPAGSGTASPSGFFGAGVNVTLSVVPAACYTFGSWSGNAPGGVVTMSGPQTVTATFLPFIAANVTPGMTITQSSFRFDRASGRFVQQVDLTNNTGGPLSGVALAIDAPNPGVSLFNGAGITGCSAPAGSAYANVGSIAPGAKSTLFLQFTNPSRGAISYTPRVLAGHGQP